MSLIFANSLEGWCTDNLPSKEFQGLKVEIETPAYELRFGKGWMGAPPADYGYIVDTTGADGDEMDCYLGPNPQGKIFVVNQNKMDSPVFDEHKCMLGYDSLEQAKEDYLAGHTSGHSIFRSITQMTIDKFKHWLEHGDVSQPLGG
jgi:hypothetical protein